jgi:hypothetical protein
MAQYILLGGHGTITGGHLNELNENIGSKKVPVIRVAWMAQQATDRCPYNQTLAHFQVSEEHKKFHRQRGILMRYQEGARTWEGEVVSGPYRLDFQGFTSDKQNANWQIQFGVGMKRGGSAAGVLMRLGHTFSVGQFIEALRRSARHATTIHLMP